MPTPNRRKGPPIHPIGLLVCLALAEPASLAAGSPGEPLAARSHSLLGSLPSEVPRGTIVLYQNVAFCDPNDVAFTTFDELLESSLVQNCAANGNRVGCAGVCPSTGPVYFQDDGTSIIADATSFGLAYGSDGGGGPAFVLEDLDADGDVDLGDFLIFQQCFGGANSPPAPTCPPGVQADFDGDGDFDLADFLMFQQCFGGAGNPPAGTCPHEPAGRDPFDLDVCFWSGTNTATPGAVGTPIAHYTLLDVPPDHVPGDEQIALIFVDVDLTTAPPMWTAERPLDSMTFSGTLLKDGSPLNNPDSIRMPGGRFGISVGEPTGAVKDAGVVRAHGGNGQQNAMRLLDAAPECTEACGTMFNPDLSFLFVDPNNNNCTFDNCVNCPTVEHASIYFRIEALPAPPPPGDDVINPNLPAVITDAGCHSVVAAIEDPLDVDMRRVRVNSVPPEGRQLAAYSAREAATTGNPLLRVFKEDGTELANNDSDGRPFNEDTYPDSDPRGVAHCPPRPGINALVSVPITTPGNYYVAVSGGGCDAWDDVNCMPDPTGTCNDHYDPTVARSGTPGQAGLYNLTIGLGSLAQVGDEPNDSIPLATVVSDSDPNTPGFQGYVSGYMGDGPFGVCLGDFDYWRVRAADLTPGQALDLEVIGGSGTDSVLMVYEKVGSAPHSLVAVNDNTISSGDSRCLVEIKPGADYYAMVMPIKPFAFFRQFGGFEEYEPGLNQETPGAGDAIPGALGMPPTGPYGLSITEIPPPPETGPFEPNDSLAQASVNARIIVETNSILPQSVEAVLGDGRYGWSLPSGGPIGDTDLFELVGLAPGITLEVTATPHPTNTTALWIAFFESNRIHDFTDIRLIFVPTGGLSASLLTNVPPTGPYYVLVTGDDHRNPVFFGSFLPWDVTIPGTLLNGQMSGPYSLSVRATSPPPPARPGSRMWGASRGDRNMEILELNPDNGEIVNVLPAPAVVNGAATGLAINNTGSVLYYQNGPGIGGTGNIMWELDPDTGAVLHSTNLTLDPFINQTSGGTQNIDGSLDGIDWAGGHIWMCLQNVARVYRWNPAMRRANLTFTAGSMGLTSFRDGLGGSDQCGLGSGSVIYVAARNTRVIAVIDVGPAGNGPANNGVMTLLGTIPDPTYPGGPGISNNGGMAVLPSASGMPPCLLYVININSVMVFLVDGDPSAGGAQWGGWVYPDFGPCGLAGWGAPP